MFLAFCHQAACAGYRVEFTHQEAVDRGPSYHGTQACVVITIYEGNEPCASAMVEDAAPLAVYEQRAGELLRGFLERSRPSYMRRGMFPPRRDPQSIVRTEEER